MDDILLFGDNLLFDDILLFPDKFLYHVGHLWDPDSFQPGMYGVQILQISVFCPLN